MNRPWTVLDGEALATLSTLPDGAFHTCCTSPPYWALRSYLPKGHPLKPLELGAEKVPDCFSWARGAPGACGACYVCRMTAVFREVRRTLRDDGTLWLNVAGSYANGHTEGRMGGQGETGDRRNRASVESQKRAGRPNGWKAKDFVNVPALLAESLRADGWYLRAEVALTKVAPMPESCRDRPTRATEKLYLFAKKAAYYYDMESERQPNTDASIARDRSGYKHAFETQFAGSPVETRHPEGKLLDGVNHPAGRNLWDWMDDTDDDLPPAVWPWRPEGGGGKGKTHYATFPLWLPLRCVRLGSSAAGCCAGCGAPWRRVVERKGDDRKPYATVGTGAWAEGAGRRDGSTAKGVHKVLREDGRGGDLATARVSTLGWRPSCGHDAPAVPCAVLDPFCGTATTGVAARLLGRTFVGVELSPDYAALARLRLADAAPLDDAAFSAPPAAPAAPPEPTLFPEPPADGDGRRRLARFITKRKDE